MGGRNAGQAARNEKKKRITGKTDNVSCSNEPARAVLDNTTSNTPRIIVETLSEKSTTRSGTAGAESESFLRRRRRRVMTLQAQKDKRRRPPRAAQRSACGQGR